MRSAASTHSSVLATSAMRTRFCTRDCRWLISRDRYWPGSTVTFCWADKGRGRIRSVVYGRFWPQVKAGMGLRGKLLGAAPRMSVTAANFSRYSSAVGSLTCGLVAPGRSGGFLNRAATWHSHGRCGSLRKASEDSLCVAGYKP